jgi:hypothetical protein
MDNNFNEEFPLMIEWVGPESLDLVNWILNSEEQADELQSLFLVKRTSSLAVTIGVLASLDQFTPETHKRTLPYFAFLAFVFFASIRPFDVLYVPKQFEKLVSAIIEDPKQLRRVIRESDFYGVLPNRETLKTAIRFLCDKKLLEPIGGNEYLISCRPIKGIGLKKLIS